MILGQVRFSQSQSKYIKVDGGLNTESPTLEVPPGQLVACQNFELSDPTGYARIKGIERVSGNRFVPSQATYTRLAVTPAGGAASAGDLFTAQYSVSGYFLEDYNGGDHAVVWAASNAQFSTYPNLIKVGGVDICTATAEDAANDWDTIHAYNVLAQEQCRSIIKKLPPFDAGHSGAIVGAWIWRSPLYGRAIYVICDDYTDMQSYIYRADNDNAWFKLYLGHTVNFNNGTAEFKTTETVTNGTVTAVIYKVVKSSGSWSGGTAAGVLYTNHPNGGTFANGDALTSASGAATANGNSYDTTRALPWWATSGATNEQFVRYNFTGNSNTEAIYGCGLCGVWELDKSEQYSPIDTGITITNYVFPGYITAFKHHLFVSYGSSWMVSGIGDPFSPWTTIYGGDEYGMGDHITGVYVTPGDTMISFHNHSISIIYGDTTANFTIKSYSHNIGAYPRSVQGAVAPVYLSNDGLSLLTATQKWGDFETSVLDSPIKSTLDGYRKGTTVSCSTSVLWRQEYRIYFGQTCFRLKMTGGQIRGYSMDFYPFDIDGVTPTFNTGTHVKYQNYSEEIVCWSHDKEYIYLLDSGDNFDGDNLDTFAIFATDHAGTPRQKKKWYDTLLEIECSGKATVHVSFDYSLYHPTRPNYYTRNISLALTDGKWDLNKWDLTIFGQDGSDNFYKMHNGGLSAGLGMFISSESKHDEQYTIRSINRRFAVRGRER